MLPVYSFLSFVALAERTHAMWFETIRDW